MAANPSRAECKGAQGPKTKQPALKQFAPLLVAMVGLPGRGKSLMAKRLSRYLNYTGDNCKVYDISEYRRKHIKKYASHEMFRADNLPAWRIRQQSFHEALEEAASWLKGPGNHVAILDGPNVSRAQREEIYDLIDGQLGYRVMFIECVCEDPVFLERNFKEILQYSVDYRDMATEEALKDLTQKMAHYKAQYESPSLGSHWELSCPMVKVLDGGEGGVVAHGVVGSKESKILSHISVAKPIQQTLYFSRHGESEFNVIGRIGGDAPLSPRGRKYALSLAKHIHALNLPSLQIWTSTLQRTKATSAHIQAPKQHLHELDEIYSHDESEFNVVGGIAGDAPLAPHGRKYALSLAKQIPALNLPSHQIWTSTLQRTKAASPHIQAPKQHLRELDEIYSHDESEFNVVGGIAGDAPLAPHCRKYALSLTKHIPALNFPSHQIWTSTLQRTKAASPHIQAPKQHLRELDEIYSGDCENLSHEELSERFPRELALRDNEKLKYRYSQGESYLDVMRRLVPVLEQLETETNVLTVSHQAVLRCILAYFLETPHEEIPYMHVPLHAIIKITLQGYSYNMETFKMPIDCVDTTRAKPINCSESGSIEDALLTLPAHFDSVANICT